MRREDPPDRLSHGWTGVLVVSALVVLAVLAGCTTEQAPVVDPPASDAPALDTDGGFDDADPDRTDDQADAQREAQQHQRDALAALAARAPNDPRAIGAVDAPVVLVQWASFLCPYCGAYARDVEPELIDRYVDTGVLRIEWRDLPVGGDDALLVAIGGRAAAEQEAFWAYHDAVFAADLRRGDDRLDRGWLIDLASELGLDPDAFAAALDREDLAAHVAAEADQARSIGIDVTPGFVVGGYLLQGEIPVEELIRVIEFAVLDAGASVP